MVQGFSKGYLGVGRRITGELVNLVLHTKLAQRTIPSMVLWPGAIDHLTKCSLCRLEDLSFHSQKTLKKLSMRM